MKRIRVIPVLTYNSEGGLVKTIKFKNPTYVGDPINAVKIFNEKEVDEIVLLDIDASKNSTPPNIGLIQEIASESFMPMGYGGGITTHSQIESIFKAGIEKVIINTNNAHNIELIKEASTRYGSQSIVGCIDVKKSFFGKYKTYIRSGKNALSFAPVDFAKRLEEYGVGEIILNSIERDGTYKGYDLELIKQISANTQVPVVACGGASSIADFQQAHEAGAHGVAAGSFFVFMPPNRAVLINYPKQAQLKTALFSKLS